MIVLGPCVGSGARSFSLTSFVPQVPGDESTEKTKRRLVADNLAPGTWWLRFSMQWSDWSGPPPVSGIIVKADFEITVDDLLVSFMDITWPCDGGTEQQVWLNPSNGPCVDQVQIGSCWSPAYGPCPDPTVTKIGFGFEHFYRIHSPAGSPAYAVTIHGQMTPFSPGP